MRMGGVQAAVRPRTIMLAIMSLVLFRYHNLRKRPLRLAIDVALTFPSVCLYDVRRGVCSTSYIAVSPRTERLLRSSAIVQMFPSRNPSLTCTFFLPRGRFVCLMWGVRDRTRRSINRGIYRHISVPS
jgi:hypothetical protein